MFKVSDVDVDIYEVFCLVRKHGGLAEVCASTTRYRLWSNLFTRCVSCARGATSGKS